MSRYTQSGVSYHEFYIWDGSTSDLTTWITSQIGPDQAVRFSLSGRTAEVMVGDSEKELAVFLRQQEPDGTFFFQAWDTVDKWVEVNIGDALGWSNTRPGFIHFNADLLNRMFTLAPEEDE